MTDEKLARLIEIAKANKDKMLEQATLTENLNEAQKFIITFCIKAGKNKVTSRHLYDVYKLWSPNPTNHVHFTKMITKLLTPRMGHSRETYFKLNYKPLTLITRAQELKGKV